ncbi:hypothetical protein ACFSUI_21115 [Ralstonia solanacearum]
MSAGEGRVGARGPFVGIGWLGDALLMPSRGILKFSLRKNEGYLLGVADKTARQVERT